MDKEKSEKGKLLKRIDELEKHIDTLEDNLIHDPLTGLKTRAFLEHDVNVYLEIIRQQSNSAQNGTYRRKEKFGFINLSIIFFDIDHFKNVNDKYGHDMGDKVLRKVAETIRSALRTGDTTARWGGEEMIASLLGADEKDTVIKAEEIRKKVEELIFPEHPNLHLTISSGIASSENGLTMPELVKRADEALYEAKRTGRNKVVAYSEISKKILK